MNPRERWFSFHRKEKEFILRVELCNLEGSFPNRIVTMNIFTWEYQKNIKLSDYMHGDQVLHRFYKSTLMLYNSVPNNKTTKTALQGITNTYKSDYTEIPCANPESHTLKDLGMFSPLLTLVCLDTEGGVPRHREGWKKWMSYLSPASSTHARMVYLQSNP